MTDTLMTVLTFASGIAVGAALLLGLSLLRVAGDTDDDSERIRDTENRELYPERRAQ